MRKLLKVDTLGENYQITRVLGYFINIGKRNKDKLLRRSNSIAFKD
jgi:hypothetical protein